MTSALPLVPFQMSHPGRKNTPHSSTLHAAQGHLMYIAPWDSVTLRRLPLSYHASFAFSSWKSTAAQSVAELFTVLESALLRQHVSALQKQDPEEQ